MADQVAAAGPHTTVDPVVEQRLTSTGRVIRWVATGYALVALLGAALPFDNVLSELPPGPPLVRDITVASALSLLFLAVGALLAGDVVKIVGSPATWRRVGSILSLGAAAFGLVIIVVFFLDRTDVWGESVAIPAFSVGMILVVLGVSVPLSVSRVESRVVAGQVGALLVFSLTASIFMGYAYGDPSVGRLFLHPEISFQASLLSVLLAIGVLLIRPASGLLSTASSPGAGGRVLRWFGPLVLFMPALLLLITELVPSTDRIDVLAFVGVGLGLFLLVLLSFFVRALDETAIEAATKGAEAQRAQIGLAQEAPVVKGIAEMLHIVDVEEIEGWEVATRYRPGLGSVAGDASAVHRLPDGSVGVVVVDLTGHGADPALWAIRVRDLLLHSLVAGKSPGEAMSIVEWSAPDDVLASALVARIDVESGTVAVCSAGHPPAIFITPQDAVLRQPTGPLLYLDPTTTYEEASEQMEPGDSVVVFSDGVADVQMSRNGRTDPERLADLLVAEGGQAKRTADLVLGFASSEPADDQTVVVVRRTS